MSQKTAQRAGEQGCQFEEQYHGCARLVGEAGDPLCIHGQTL